MFSSLRIPRISALVLGAAILASAPAGAAPMADSGVIDAIRQSQTQVEKARLVCDRFGRCWNRPNYWRRGWGYVGPGYGFVAPGFVAPPLYRPRPRLVCNAWGRCWRRW